MPISPCNCMIGDSFVMERISNAKEKKGKTKKGGQENGMEVCLVI